MELKDRLRELRGDITQIECAKNLGVLPGNYTKWEKGVAPTYKVLIQIADYYGVSLDYLTGRVDYKNPDFKGICEDTGLTENALKGLQLIRESSELNSVDLIGALNFLLERELDSSVQDALDAHQFYADEHYMFEYFPHGNEFALSTLLFYIANEYRPDTHKELYKFCMDMMKKKASGLKFGDCTVDQHIQLEEIAGIGTAIQNARQLELNYIENIPNKILSSLRSQYEKYF